MATSNTTDEINIQDLKVEDSTTVKAEGTTKKVKPKTEKPPKQEKPKQQKAQAAAAVVEEPVEELNFNRTPEEVEKALSQWTRKPATLNQKSNEKM